MRTARKERNMERPGTMRTVALVGTLALALSAVGQGKVIYVDDDATRRFLWSVA
jgi:hypothetical protein